MSTIAAREADIVTISNWALLSSKKEKELNRIVNKSHFRIQGLLEELHKIIKVHETLSARTEQPLHKWWLLYLHLFI